MKKTFISILTIATFMIMPLFSVGQDKGPGEPPGDPEGPPIDGGGAPIGSGIAVLLTLGAAYGTRKVYQYWKNQKEELED